MLYQADIKLIILLPEMASEACMATPSFEILLLKTKLKLNQLSFQKDWMLISPKFMHQNPKPKVTVGGKISRKGLGGEDGVIMIGI